MKQTVYYLLTDTKAQARVKYFILVWAKLIGERSEKKIFLNPRKCLNINRVDVNLNKELMMTVLVNVFSHFNHMVPFSTI